MTDAVLALDIGNGSIKYGLFRAGRREEGGRLPLDVEPDSLAALAAGRAAGAVSVNPPVLARARDACPGLRAVGIDVAYPVPVHYRPPEACGPDRVMAAVGALRRCPDAPGVLVLEAGTCLTATVAVRGEGVLGGAILPGPDLMARALADGTAGLPLVRPAPPRRAIADSTEEGIRSGIAAALGGAVGELCARFRAESPVPLTVVAAGTGAGALAAQASEIESVHPFATLWGVFETVFVRGTGRMH